MKKASGAWRILAAAVVATAALVPIAVASRDGGGATAPREIRLVVRDMTFYLEGQKTPNPALRMRAGERVRIVLRNEDPGMKHDLVIKSWQVGTPTLDRSGQETAVAFRVPDRRGIETYSCTPHAEMMRGSIRVE